MTIYNEIDPFACQWTRNLIAAGHVAPGVVDERSIVDLRATDVAGRGQRHFFAGLAGWSYALRLAGVPDDADIWTASCPCQPFSGAGRKRGTSDERHLWPVLRELVAECRPPILLGEQVASPDGRAWFATFRVDLESLGYAVGAADLCAAGIGAPHIRQRLYFVAYADDAGSQGRGKRRDGADQRAARQGGVVGGMVDSDRQQRERRASAGRQERDRPEQRGDARDPWADAEWIPCSDGRSRPAQPGAFPLAHGVPGRVGKLRAYGNAIVSEQAATFIRAALQAGTVSP